MAKKQEAPRTIFDDWADEGAAARAKAENAPRNYLLPSFPQEFEPEESMGQQALQRVSEFAGCWWSIFEMLREIDSHGVDGKGELPEWARARIGDWKQQHEAYDQMRRFMDDAKRSLALAEGQQNATFEIWTKRGHRLDGRHEYWADADEALKKLAGRHADAYVCRVHRRAPVYGLCTPELLDTLIGPIYWAGVAYGTGEGEEDEHTIQDATGRTVTVTTSTLVAHPVFHRMTKDARSRLAHSTEREGKSHG